jgi:hypothetical protein
MEQFPRAWRNHQLSLSTLDRFMDIDLVGKEFDLCGNTGDPIYYDQLFEMRQRVGAKNVFWVLPAGNLPAGGVPIERIQGFVQAIAQYYGDTVLPIRGLQPDGIHPSWSGYKDIVERTR